MSEFTFESSATDAKIQSNQRTMGVVKKPKPRAIPLHYPSDDPIMIALNLIVEYGKFYREWKEKQAAEIGGTKATK